MLNYIIIGTHLVKFISGAVNTFVMFYIVDSNIYFSNCSLLMVFLFRLNCWLLLKLCLHFHFLHIFFSYCTYRFLNLLLEFSFCLPIYAAHNPLNFYKILLSFSSELKGQRIFVVLKTNGRNIDIMAFSLVNVLFHLLDDIPTVSTYDQCFFHTYNLFIFCHLLNFWYNPVMKIWHCFKSVILTKTPKNF